MFYFGSGQPVTSHSLPSWSQTNAAGAECGYNEQYDLDGFSDTGSRLVLNQPSTSTLSWDATNVGSTPITLGPISIYNTAVNHSPAQRSSGYVVTVQFAPIECQTFTINSLTMSNMNILDYEDTPQDFTDPGDNASTGGLCGDRSFKLLDASNDSDLALSWVSLA